jgi:uncharacterized SAM-dependent methyltransferase
VRELLQPHGVEVQTEPDSLQVAHDSPQELMELYERSFGPILAAKAVLGDGFDALRADYVALFEEANEASDGSLRMPASYLVTLGRKLT